MQVTQDQLQRFCAISDDQVPAFLAGLNASLEKYDISTQIRLRYFMAQTAFESGFYTRWQENLNYSDPARLVKVWPTRFSMDKSKTEFLFAPDYVHQPEKLANAVYAGRGGNGNAASGDGWNFRGRGPIQITFKDAYTKASQDIYGDDRLLTEPDELLQPDAGFMSAGWFWNSKNLNARADTDSFTEVTRLINGSTATVPERIVVLNKANSIF